MRTRRSDNSGFFSDPATELDDSVDSIERLNDLANDRYRLTRIQLDLLQDGVYSAFNRGVARVPDLLQLDVDQLGELLKSDSSRDKVLAFVSALQAHQAPLDRGEDMGALAADRSLPISLYEDPHGDSEAVTALLREIAAQGSAEDSGRERVTLEDVEHFEEGLVPSRRRDVADELKVVQTMVSGPSGAPTVIPDPGPLRPVLEANLCSPDGEQVLRDGASIDNLDPAVAPLAAKAAWLAARSKPGFDPNKLQDPTVVSLADLQLAMADEIRTSPEERARLRTEVADEIRRFVMAPTDAVSAEVVLEAPNQTDLESSVSLLKGRVRLSFASETTYEGLHGEHVGDQLLATRVFSGRMKLPRGYRVVLDPVGPTEGEPIVFSKTRTFEPPPAGRYQLTVLHRGKPVDSARVELPDLRQRVESLTEFLGWTIRFPEGRAVVDIGEPERVGTGQARRSKVVPAAQAEVAGPADHAEVLSERTPLELPPGRHVLGAAHGVEVSLDVFAGGLIRGVARGRDIDGVVLLRGGGAESGETAVRGEEVHVDFYLLHGWVDIRRDGESAERIELPEGELASEPVSEPPASDGRVSRVPPGRGSDQELRQNAETVDAVLHELDFSPEAVQLITYADSAGGSGWNLYPQADTEGSGVRRVTGRVLSSDMFLDVDLHGDDRADATLRLDFGGVALHRGKTFDLGDFILAGRVAVADGPTTPVVPGPLSSVPEPPVRVSDPRGDAEEVQAALRRLDFDPRRARLVVYPHSEGGGGWSINPDVDIHGSGLSMVNNEVMTRQMYFDIQLVGDRYGDEVTVRLDFDGVPLEDGRIFSLADFVQVGRVSVVRESWGTPSN